MAEGGLLHAAADLVDYGIGEPDGMNVIYSCGVAGLVLTAARSRINPGVGMADRLA